MPERWATIREAADYLKVSVPTVRRMITRGEVQARRISARLIRVDLESLDNVGRPLQYIGGDAG